MSQCKARQQLDQMYCAECCLLWDIADLNPPECRRVKAPAARERAHRTRHKEHINRLHKSVTRENLNKLREIVGR